MTKSMQTYMRISDTTLILFIINCWNGTEYLWVLIFAKLNITARKICFISNRSFAKTKCL